MKRLVFTLCPLLSLLLLLAAVTLWARSFWRAEELAHRSVDGAGATTHEWSLALTSGELGLTRSSWAVAVPPEDRGWHVERRHPRPAYVMNGGFAGFQHRHVTGFGTSLDELRVPMWSITLLLALLPAGALRTALRRRRLRRGAAQLRCPACGYDLRGTVGRPCPECGAAAGAASLGTLRYGG